MDEFLDDFLAETAEMLGALSPQLPNLGRGPADGAAFAQILRFLHTVKGTCGFLRLNRLEALAHAGETLASRCADEMPPPQAITLIVETIRRIGAILQAIGTNGAEPDGHDDDLIFHLLAVAGRSWPAGKVPRQAAANGPELGAGCPVPAAFGSQAADPASTALFQLAPVAGALTSSCELLHQMVGQLDRADWAEPMARLCAAAAELQQGITGVRMRPIELAWRSLPGIVRDLSRRLGKKIDLELTGAKTPVDARLLGPLKQALVHMVRNCADHGLEPATLRLAAGKREAGKITLRARTEAGHVVVEIGDDGRGLDAREIGAAALGRGLVSDAQLAKMDAQRIHQFIFDAGVSTAPKITKVSGRGVGMDVVRANIAAIGGSLAVSSKAGESTSITVRIPAVLSAQIPTQQGASRTRETTIGRQNRKRIAA